MGPVGGVDLPIRALSQHQLILRDHEHGVRASRGVLVYFPAAAGPRLPTADGWKTESN